MSKQYLFDADARNRIAAGAKRLADAVRVTLGPAGPQRDPPEVLRRPDGHARTA